MPRNGFSLLDVVSSLKFDKHFLPIICLIFFLKKNITSYYYYLNIKLSYIFNAYYKGLKKLYIIILNIRLSYTLYYLTSK